MAPKGPKWHADHQSLMLELMTDRKYRPVGGATDGKMAKKRVVLWERLLVDFKERLPAVNEHIRKNNKRLKDVKSEFTVEMLKAKYQEMSGKYKKVKKEFKLRSKDMPTTGCSAVQQLEIEARQHSAREAWEFYDKFHAIFKDCARYDNKFSTCSLTPVKANTTQPDQPQPELPIPPQQNEQDATTEVVVASGSEFDASSSSSFDSESDSDSDVAPVRKRAKTLSEQKTASNSIDEIAVISTPAPALEEQQELKRFGAKPGSAPVNRRSQLISRSALFEKKTVMSELNAEKMNMLSEVLQSRDNAKLQARKLELEAEAEQKRLDRLAADKSKEADQLMKFIDSYMSAGNSPMTAATKAKAVIAQLRSQN
jgi:hypothetical protein